MGTLLCVVGISAFAIDLISRALMRVFGQPLIDLLHLAAGARIASAPAKGAGL